MRTRGKRERKKERLKLLPVTIKINYIISVFLLK